MKRKINSLYIHIPFCEHLCEYCDFTKMFYLRSYVSKYINVLCIQIDDLKDAKFNTVYIGGGTPSSLSPFLLEKLLKSLSSHLKNKSEFTIEVNPESLSKNKIAIMQKYGINRISMGVQSFNNDILKEINRHHSARMVRYWINYLNSVNLTNINIDLIYGLPNQTLTMFKKDIDIATSLKIKHISSYSLTVSKGTAFYNNGIKEVDEDKSREYYDLLYKELKKKGFYRYEVSNFALRGYESKHNINYWKDNNYIGLGLGAHGYEGDVRYQNTSNIKEYLNKNYIKDKETLSRNSMMEEFIMLNLRMSKGINKREFKKRFGVEIGEILKEKINELVNNKLLISNKYYLKTTYEGMMMLDHILLDLFLALE